MKLACTLLVALLLGIPGWAQGPQKKISKQAAIKAALAEVKGGKIKSAELEKEEGKLVWSFDVKAGGKITEVWVDAYTGKVVKSEIETPEKEKKEKEEKGKDKN